MGAKEWAMANKAKSVLGLVISLSTVVMLPIGAYTWAQEQREEVEAAAERKIAEAALITQGREQVIHSTQKATHDYDFYELRSAQAEEELIILEEDAAAGVQLTATQQRKMRRLEDDVATFEARKQDALDQLQQTEDDHDETE